MENGIIEEVSRLLVIDNIIKSNSRNEQDSHIVGIDWHLHGMRTRKTAYTTTTTFERWLNHKGYFKSAEDYDIHDYFENEIYATKSAHLKEFLLYYSF